MVSVPFLMGWKLTWHCPTADMLASASYQQVSKRWQLDHTWSRRTVQEQNKHLHSNRNQAFAHEHRDAHSICTAVCSQAQAHMPGFCRDHVADEMYPSLPEATPSAQY
jgi:hypothetical protein